MKIGDKVVIEKSYYGNLHCMWVSSMDNYIGKEVIILDIDSENDPPQCFIFNHPLEYWFPIECIGEVSTSDNYEIY